MKSLMPWKKREREVANLRKDFGRLFDRFFDEPLFPIPNLFSEDAWYPTVDISEDKKGIIVKAEIPGVDQKDIEVYLAGRSLTIKGEKKREKDEADGQYHRVESSFGYYKRTIELPADVDESGMDAKYKNGVLKIRLKKAKEAETKRIKIITNN